MNQNSGHRLILVRTNNRKSAIQVEIDSIELDGGRLSLAAYNSATAALNPAVTAKIDRIMVRPIKDRLEFDATAELVRGGKFSPRWTGKH